MGGLACVVSIPDSCDDLKNPVKCENILRMHRLLSESGVASALVSPRILAKRVIFGHFLAVLHLAQI